MRDAILLLALFLSAAQAAQGPLSLRDAEKELFSAKYDKAAELYSELLGQDPSASQAYYGLVRSLLGAHRQDEAYAAAEEGLKQTSETPASQTAAGLAMYRSGDLPAAENHFQSALSLSPNYPGALAGMASIYSVFSRFKTSRGLLLSAFHNSPNDPELSIAYAYTLEGHERIRAFEHVLEQLDPETEEWQEVRSQIALDRAAGDRKLRRRVGPLRRSRIKLSRGRVLPRNQLGVPPVELRAQIDGRPARLTLDTGASGISLSPAFAKKAGLEMLTEIGSIITGIGNAQKQLARRYLASEIRLGNLAFVDYPVSVFQAVQSTGADGIIGTDVFEDFLITIDFPNLELSLEPLPALSDPDEPADAQSKLPSGFHRALRFESLLTVPTTINDGQPALFLLDSGSGLNIIDTTTAAAFTEVDRNSHLSVQGMQGKVNRVSRTGRVALEFAGVRQQSASMVAISMDSMSDSIGVEIGGILGMSALYQLEITIDYREGAVRFRYNK